MAAAADPSTYDEYRARCAANAKTTGFGFDSIRVHQPCPFCGAADFMVLSLLDTHEVMRRVHTCGGCGRSGMCVFHVDEPARTVWEFVQTGGPDQPPWLDVPFRRVDPPAQTAPADLPSS